MKVSSGQLLFVAVAAFVLAGALVVALLARNETPSEPIRYSVIRHAGTYTHGYTRVLVYGREIDSTENYRLIESPTDPDIVPDAFDGKCYMDVQGDAALLHIPPDEGVCKS